NATPAAGASNDLPTVFASLRASAVWPVQGGTADAITSTFGPRIKLSTGAYDWHRGIDLDAPEGTPVLAMLGGTLFGIREYADGGTTVILRHGFPSPVAFQGRSLTAFYTFSMHLSTIEPSLVTAAAANQHPAVAAGAVIGTVGHSGTAVDDHLHLELRVGTPYSLEWQLANPTSQYGADAFGFDPHVHPMYLVPPAAAHGMALSLTQSPTSKRDGRVRFSADDDRPLLDRIAVAIVRRSDGRTMASHVLDLDERLGFDATSTAGLDTPTTSKPYFSPSPFGTASPYVTDLVIPKGWVGSFSGSKFRTTVTATDVWGNAVTLSW
ncbi:MAG: M23 family metallopeptidase, partial [Actinomycetota bacterium]